MQNLSRVSLRNTFGNESKALDLREFEDLESARVHATGAGEVDDDVDVTVLLHGLLDCGVHGEERLACAPVELLDVMTAEGVNHGGDGGRGAPARVVEVEHALDGAGLQAVDERARGRVEGAVRRPRVRALAGVEVHDLVIRLRALARGVDRADAVGVLGHGRGRRFGRGGCGGGGGDGVEAVFRRGHAEREGHDLGDMRVGAVHLDGDAEGLAEEAHRLEALLVVGASTADVDTDLVGDERRLVLFQCTDDAFEGGGNIGEVGDTTTDDEDLAIGVRLAARDEINCADSENYIHTSPSNSTY